MTGKIYVKVCHLHQGLDLIGSATSMHFRNAEMEVTPIGIKTISIKTGRIVLLPWTNIRGCELFPEGYEPPKRPEPKKPVDIGQSVPAKNRASLKSV